MHHLLKAIITGESRPVRTLPGEVGALVVRRLYEDAAKNLAANDQERFRLIGALCARANDAALRCLHDEAGQWIGLANEVTAELARHIRASATSFVKSNQAYVHYARQDYQAALSCLAEAPVGEIPAAKETISGASTSPNEAMRHALHRLHFQHLAARIHLAAGDFQTAITSLTEAALDAGVLAGSQTRADLVELLNFMCSRIAGEMAIAVWHAPTPEEYFAATERIVAAGKEGSFSEYLFFRHALVAMVRNDDPQELVEFIELGRMKTSCWYAAVTAIATRLPANERKALAIRSATWRDMPASLRSRLLELSDERSRRPRTTPEKI